VPVFFQQQINHTTRLAIWSIEETEEFFLSDVPLQKEVTHPHKRLQHLAARFLLKYLFPDFPYELIETADTKKPFLTNEQYHFSISHCGDYAAAIVSSDKRVGIDIELPTLKVARVAHKFLNEEERKTFSIQYSIFNSQQSSEEVLSVLTQLWSAKEAVFKWYGLGGVDFREHIQLTAKNENKGLIKCDFKKTKEQLSVNVHHVGELVLAWVVN